MSFFERDNLILRWAESLRRLFLFEMPPSYCYVTTPTFQGYAHGSSQHHFRGYNSSRPSYRFHDSRHAHRREPRRQCPFAEQRKADLSRFRGRIKGRSKRAANRAA